jgi:hypothetical protein
MFLRGVVAPRFISRAAEKSFFARLTKKRLRRSSPQS